MNNSIKSMYLMSFITTRDQCFMKKKIIMSLGNKILWVQIKSKPTDKNWTYVHFPDTCRKMSCMIACVLVENVGKISISLIEKVIVHKYW